MLGLPPQHMLDSGKQTSQFFDSYVDTYGRKRYQLKSLEKYSREHNTNEQPGKKYFTHNTLPEIIKAAPIPAQRAKPQEAEKEQYSRLAFIDFVQGLLNLDPLMRWTPQQARTHPFITGEKFTGPFVPLGSRVALQGSAHDRPYGGLPPSQPQGTRAYKSAASYNQHLNQHQATTAAAAAAVSSPTNGSAPYRNPYLPAANNQQPAQPGSLVTVVQAVDGALEGYSSSVPSSAGTQPTYHSGTGQGAQRLQHHHSQTGPHGHSYYGGQGGGNATSSSYNYQQQQQQQSHSQGSSQSSQHRGRAATTNHMDVVPPAIARIANMGVDHSGIGRNTLTPVLKRDEREWVRQNQAGGPPQSTYPQLEYLQQQAERMPNTWGPRMYHSSGGSGGQKMALNVNTSGSQQSHSGPQSASQFQPPPAAHVIDSQERPVGLRDVMSSVRSAAGTGMSSGQSLDSSGASASISTPPLAYTSTSTSNTGHRYGSNSSNSYQQTSSSSLPYDQYEARPSSGTPGGGSSGDLFQIHTPLQPNQYQPAYSGSTGQSNSMRSGPQATQQRQNTMGSGGSNVGVGTSGSQASAGSFYAPGVSPALGGPAGQSTYQPAQQQQRSLYGAQINQPPLAAGGIGADGRRLPNEMDVWSR